MVLMWPETLGGGPTALYFSARPFIIVYLFESCGKLS